MIELKQYITEVRDFPKPGIVFRDISPLLRNHLEMTLQALSELLSDQEWSAVDVLAGVESRGFVLAAALAVRQRKGLVMIRKAGKLPPPTVKQSYQLEYGSDTLEMKPGSGRVLLVDDVLATGGTLQAAADLCDRAGYQLCHLMVLIDLKLIKHFHWRTLEVRSVLQYE